MFFLYFCDIKLFLIMKRYIFLSVIFLVMGILNAQSLHVESSTEKGLRLHYSLPKVNMGELSNLPSESHYIAIPKGATPCVDVQMHGSRTLRDVDLSPIKEMIEGADIPDGDIVTLQPTTIRGLDVALLSITPYRYEPTQKTLELIQDIDIDIRFEGGSGRFGEARYLSPDWEHILRNMIINKEMLPESDYYSLIKSARDGDEEGCEYLIIAPDNAEILAWADTLKAFRTKQGILTKVVSLAECGGNNTDIIRNYILNAYNNWAIPPSAVLLFGGYCNGSGIVPYYHHTIADEYSVRRYPTDYPYSDMNGDSLPDLAISRITARSIEDYQAFVKKTIEYETNPPVDAAYYDHPIVTSGYEADKWFLISSQSFNGFYRDKIGKHPSNFYMLHQTSIDPPDSTWSTGYNVPVLLDYFGPNGQNYIPEYIGELNEWQTKSDTLPLHNALKEGSFLTTYRGHSHFNAWWFPQFSTTSLSTLSNEPVTFVISITCSTGLFTDDNPGLIDAFCIKKQGGAVGGIGALSLTHSYFNDILSWGIYDCIWPNYLPDMGGDTSPLFIRPSYVLANAKLYFNYHFFMPAWWINKENSTRHLFCYTGETYLNLFTEVPQPLQITHGLYMPSNANEFTVTAEEDAIICLSHDGEIIGVEQSQGQACSFALPDLEEGERIILTATKQNHFRYEYEIPVISDNGPYVVVDNDGWLVENGFDFLHNGEYACVGVKLHNYGNHAAENVTMSLSCTSPFVEITQATCQTQNIASNQTVILNSAFRFNIADDLPDMTEVVFNVHVNDGNGEKECSITQHIAAPALMIKPEITYENSSHQAVLQLENPGHTDLHIQIANQGHFDTNPVNVYLEILAPFITIDSPSRTFNSIEQESVQDVYFSIDAQNGANDEGWLKTRITLDDGIRQTTIDTLLPFGGFNETFDPDHFSAQNWQFSGNASWTLTEDEAHSGNYSIKSGEISHGQSSSISITKTTQATEISFFKKHSSEFKYDKLHFYIDGEDMGEWSGSRPWNEERYPLTQGTHTFKWSYTKDNSVTLPPDCAWIDDVSIAPAYTAIASSGEFLTACRNESVHLECSYAYHYQTLEWSTLGDGHFDHPHSLHPEYFPGVQEMNNGSTTLQLNVDGVFYSLQLVLTDEISLGDAIAGDDFIDPEETVFSHYSVEAQDGITYFWQLEPEEAGHLFAHGHEADVVWSFDPSITEATLTVTADASCSQMLSKTIKVDVLGAEERIAVPFSLFPNPTDGKIYLRFEEAEQGKVFVEVFNLLGEKMITKNIHPLPNCEAVSLDLNRLAPGLYIIKLNTERGSFSEKVILR
jgi:hypothetical protein